ncbi:MAG: molecular chaperone HtpG [Candidatus Fluviicola riflensis]|nr:MAG: molecular chaperone HtpG [Candidatus Fluviicola riflensis]OGS76113.1 MAG: molecular chaperone HtpG [Candidatus Fluviicola riflensis]OGS82013.1 MAG: molecular chaperone HtpG [Fluviicola sp. RIFCSPHIGHO2_01_FULL_43_53]OGS83472.1 MAG: molecular chaperone HtpG [Fluviicola sp. RIFCSPHIGHO2_12_FULL_43_24]
MKTGQIHVSTENIFPIIKKFLYSDHEIFLRELVSNAVDASQKLKVLSSQGEYKGELGDLKVEVLLDKEAKTLTIRDNGIGMTAEEIDKYINQIAFSGAEEFVKLYEGKEGAESIIGHFGLGFYSAFMVAEKVQIRTLSRHEGAQAVQWESNGSPEYTIEDIEKETRGTDIVLFINEESVEFLEKSRIQGILDKYCKFLPIPVFFGMKTEYINSPEGEQDEEGKVKRVSVDVPNQVNNPAPAWTKAPVDLTDEDYNAFYRELYPMSFEDPLFHIHLNVDYPFNLTGILYFPRIKENVEVQRNKINLYSNQVFITDSVAEIVPEFLTLLHGVLDSPDIPLNVSRSYLQSDGNVKKISAHITKKVADKLAEMFKKDRADFESKWDDLKIFVEYGMLSDDKFAEKAKSFALIKNSEGKYFTIEEFKDQIAPLQTDKNNKIVALYTHSVEEHFSFVKQAKDRGYQVAIIDGPLAPHWISKVEQSFEDFSFLRVDADTLDQLIQKEGELPSKLTEEQEATLKPLFETAVDARKFKIEFKSMSETDAPIIVTQPEFIRRMMEQQKMGGGGFFGAFPESYSMVVNANHSKVGMLLETADAEEQQTKVKQLTDLALLSQGMLKGEELSNFIERSIAFI